MAAFALILLAYLIGSIPSAIILCKIMHLPDPRTIGSKNPGATNALRIGGKKLGAIVLLCDALKGLLAVLLGRLFEMPLEILGFIGLAAFLGHVFPIFYGFQGGKGVATAAGVLLGLSPLLFLLALLAWAATLFFSRLSSLASLVAVSLLPIFMLCLHETDFFIPLLIMVLVVIGRHKDNIKRLITNKEPHVGEK